MKDIKFKSGVDFNTLLINMAGCAIREKVERIKQAEQVYSPNEVLMLIEPEREYIDDCCRVIAQATPEEMRSSRNYEKTVREVIYHENDIVKYLKTKDLEIKEAYFPLTKKILESLGLSMLDIANYKHNIEKRKEYFSFKNYKFEVWQSLDPLFLTIKKNDETIFGCTVINDLDELELVNNSFKETLLVDQLDFVLKSLIKD